jgi:hypothetical protein
MTAHAALNMRYTRELLTNDACDAHTGYRCSTPAAECSAAALAVPQIKHSWHPFNLTAHTSSAVYESDGKFRLGFTYGGCTDSMAQSGSGAYLRRQH